MQEMTRWAAASKDRRIELIEYVQFSSVLLCFLLKIIIKWGETTEEWP